MTSHGRQPPGRGPALPPAAAPLQRHQLVWPDALGWAGLKAGGGAAVDPAASQAGHGEGLEAVARECIGHWAARDLPLVVTRQPAEGDGTVALGLPAPACWKRGRYALRLPPERIRRIGEFPLAVAVEPLLAAALCPAWRALIAEIDRLARAPTRVYGSHGWQALTGEHWLRPGSDLDLLLEAGDAAAADAICACLVEAAAWPGPRLDGELLIGGAGIAWREWRRSRGIPGGKVLAKRRDGLALVDAAMAFGPAVAG